MSASLPSTMRAVILAKPGPVEGLEVRDQVPVPSYADSEVLIKVHSFGINRADTLQRKGAYPAPPGSPADILGLEASGTIVAVGSDATKKNFKVGDHVMALLGGGGYAEYINVDEGSVMKVPEKFSLLEAAAIPENFLTSYGLLFLQGKVQPGDTVVVYAAGSGIGVSVIQLAVQLVPDVKVIAIAGEQKKIDKAIELGAKVGFNYKQDEKWDEKVLEYTNGKGVNLVLDCVGASFVPRTLNMLGLEGRWVLYGTMGGHLLNEFSIGIFLRKRLQLQGTTLRNRSLEFKRNLVDEFESRALPALIDGRIRLVIDKVFPVEQVQESHQHMEKNINTGKIVVTFEQAKDEL